MAKVQNRDLELRCWGYKLEEKDKKK